MQLLLDEDSEPNKVDIKGLHGNRKTYIEELEEKSMKNKIVARKNPFANLTDFDLSEEDCELMRERAKIYMAKHEWDRALQNLNRTLCQWGAKSPEIYDSVFPPNKHVQTKT